jgi:hypothetical protein
LLSQRRFRLLAAVSMATLAAADLVGWAAYWAIHAFGG